MHMELSMCNYNTILSKASNAYGPFLCVTISQLILYKASSRYFMWLSCG